MEPPTQEKIEKYKVEIKHLRKHVSALLEAMCKYEADLDLTTESTQILAQKF